MTKRVASFQNQEGSAPLTDFFKSKLYLSKREVDFDYRGFDTTCPKQTQHLQNIGENFVEGFNLALDNGDVDKLSLALGVEDRFRGFRYEGAAMSVSIIDATLRAFSQRKQYLEFLKISQSYKYLFYVGIGWTFAKIPWSRSLLFKGMHPLLRWLALDGWGFHDTFFYTKRIVTARKIRFRGASRSVYLQGVGRAMWFVHCGSPERIHQQILTWPVEAQGELWSGIGLAAVYAGTYNDSPDIPDRLLSASSRYRRDFAQGCAFAACARALEGRCDDYVNDVSLLVTGRTQSDLADICRSFEAKFSGEGTPESYQKWRHSVRSTI
ncbi:DUF1702 family protein [Exilibacterium tricleocarpae]|uniref:DUF1702 family protein n=1 Tax=Exilibacterium tricleocarpae TaxID=2591008 RepID=A0A545U9P4_9GAMM|nr:DUF1702 family protein [Exilibacterium tricleocarpae]TQV86159.1 DUF1702 family protein [Exilibacterium tricleocarpae]